jgi:hypothetical protein
VTLDTNVRTRHIAAMILRFGISSSDPNRIDLSGSPTEAFIPFARKAGSFAMLLAMRRASSRVSDLAIPASRGSAW